MGNDQMRIIPHDLRTIYAPPSVIYWRGTLPNRGKPTLRSSVLVRPIAMAKHTIRTLVAPLVQQGWCIVSGGALGADSMAHEAALQAQGRTVAVLGSGFCNSIRDQIRLFERILNAAGRS